MRLTLHFGEYMITNEYRQIFIDRLTEISESRDIPVEAWFEVDLEEVTEPGELAQAEAIAENISWLFGQSGSPLPWFPSSGSVDAEAMQFYEELDGNVYPLVRLIALACSSNASDLAIGAAIRACKG